MERKYNTVMLKKDDGIATVVMNRPERRNGLNEEMFEELISALEEAAGDDSTRVVILTGAGRHFSVGADMGTGPGREAILEERDAEKVRRGLRHSHKIVDLLTRMEKPSIAMVNGIAAGGGFDWALSCDVRIAAESARFRSFTQIGLVPGQAGAFFMVHLMGYAKACQMLFTADILNAKQALDAGLVNTVVPDSELEAETMDVARRMSKQAPIALRLGKLLLRKGLEMSLDTSLEICAIAQTICISSQDSQEAIKAFREKRQPVYQGK
ncbi:MAG: enoyl-CoA hydratase/isomerase family protein [Dehalococcoidia bacterium]|jgi:enoyl-CoA hydratase/carnithine racemase|nr:enoyl-CoA hydratase/isomerase family protein [Dehalococcoidia bacterium]MDP6510813.1 enoyl-CoA hydratase/isomerase family protein [Dehalococcoidia bacterium]